MGRLIEAVTAAETISEKHGIPLSELVDTFAEIPTVDAVKAVRCRECLCSVPHSGGMVLCLRYYDPHGNHMLKSGNGFCDFGTTE